MSKSTFPTTIYVVWNGKPGDEDAFLSVINPAEDDLHEYNGQAVALYGKASVGQVQITQAIVE